MKTNEMTPRERFWTCAGFKEPDRVPIIFGGVESSIIAADGRYGYKALMKHLGIRDYEVPDGDFGAINVDPRLYQRLHSDSRLFLMGDPPRELISLSPLVIRDTMWGNMIRYMYAEGALPGDIPMATFPDDLAPLRQMERLEDIDSYKYWPDPNDPVYYEGAAEQARKLYEENDYVIYGVPGYAGSIDVVYTFLRGFDNWLTDPYVRPDYYRKLKEKITCLSIEITVKWLKEVGAYIDIVDYDGDMGTQEGPLFSPEHYEKWVQPYQKRWVDEVKKATKAKIQLHSCGSIYKLIPAIIETGFDMLNPLQPLAKDMEPERLKKEFGRKIILCGGVDIQRLLPFGTKEEVEEGVKELIRTMAPGGGWMIAPANNIPPDVPPENILAMYDTAYEYGRYPIN